MFMLIQVLFNHAHFQDKLSLRPWLTPTKTDRPRILHDINDDSNKNPGSIL